MTGNRVFRVEVADPETGEVKSFSMVSSTLASEAEAWERVVAQFGAARVVSVTL
ncbi:hypothetical protein [Salinicola corii]|uniref:hypothetical protein n=1 Tax=Salinicola corii TaxID=2606937 RepID=UPI001658EC2D|nr:hypothetical protein [Salinicola corii]